MTGYAIQQRFVCIDFAYGMVMMLLNTTGIFTEPQGRSTSFYIGASGLGYTGNFVGKAKNSFLNGRGER